MDRLMNDCEACMPRKDCIVVVEDDPRLARLVRSVLDAVGYRVVLASDGKSALEMVAMEQPDLLVLDLLLPHGMDGYEVCRRVRDFSSVPIIMLTAKALEGDKLRGFEAGADDYLTKPFSSAELLARIKAVLRRSRSPQEAVTSTFVCGDLSINFAQHRVFARGKEVRLTATEYALLRELAVHANYVMLHTDLLSSVWGPEYRDDVEYLRAYVRYLRLKLEVEPSHPSYILTIPGVGYMLNCPAK
jgi:two-component system KDP operon response regulator KdpE